MTLRASHISFSNLSQLCDFATAGSFQSGLDSAFYFSKEEENLPSLDGITSFVNSSSLFAHVKDKKRAIKRIYDTAKNPENSPLLSQLVKILNIGPISDLNDLLLTPLLSDLTVLAVINKKITITQLATVFYTVSIFKRYNSKKILQLNLPSICEINLFKRRKSINPVAERYLNSIFADLPIDITQFFYEIGNSRASAKRFFLAPCYTDGTTKIVQLRKSLLLTKTINNSDALHELLSHMFSSNVRNRTTIMDAVYAAKLTNHFREVVIDKINWRIYPSVKMMEVIFSLLQLSIKPIYRFGLTYDLKENGLNGNRDVSLRSPFALLPKTADNLYAPHDEFTSHDLIFHCFVAGSIPRPHQHLFLAFADIYIKLSNKSNPLIQLADRYIDMDPISYLKLLPGNRADLDKYNECFWQAVVFHHHEQKIRELIEGYEFIYNNIQKSSPEKLKNLAEKFITNWVVEFQTEQQLPQILEAYTKTITQVIINQPKLANKAGVTIKKLYELADEEKSAHEIPDSLLRQVSNNLRVIRT